MNLICALVDARIFPFFLFGHIEAYEKGLLHENPCGSPLWTLYQPAGDPAVRSPAIVCRI
ncbi:hypothetical protein [Mitsuokella sp.]|uniref:hypothetical protein n=1 Tax=Mitsuokella sp. TaxID=2049034 RepID=UPI003D7C4E1F